MHINIYMNVFVIQTTSQLVSKQLMNEPLMVDGAADTSQLMQAQLQRSTWTNTLLHMLMISDALAVSDACRRDFWDISPWHIT